MNSINISKLKEITNVICVNNIDEKATFDYFRIAGINKKDNIKHKNILYFISYITEEEFKKGWYINRIDLRKHILSIIKKNPEYTFILDKTITVNLESNYKYIVVEDINQTIDALFNYFKGLAHAKTIAITGSVGKTSCVGIIESVLKEKYNVMRIYSKRITPLILKTYIINYLNKTLDHIVLEYGLYYHDHVKILSDLLKPDIAAIINISSSHLGIEKIKTIDDICKYKSLIMEHAQYGLIIKNDQYLENLRLKNGVLFYKSERLFKNNILEIEKVDLDIIKVHNDEFIINNNFSIKPFILSNLAKKQYAIAYYIGKRLNLSEEIIKKGMDNYVSVENRISKKSAFGKYILFDGDITTYERMKELSEALYDNKSLVLRKVGSSENTLRIANINELFPKFKKVYIFSDVEYLDELKNESNVIIVKDHSFMKDINGTIIYHYSGYFRVWDRFEEKNLNIYDKDKYPIIKEKK